MKVADLAAVKHCNSVNFPSGGTATPALNSLKARAPNRVDFRLAAAHYKVLLIKGELLAAGCSCLHALASLLRIVQDCAEHRCLTDNWHLDPPFRTVRPGQTAAMQQAPGRSC